MKNIFLENGTKLKILMSAASGVLGYYAFYSGKMSFLVWFAFSFWLLAILDETFKRKFYFTAIFSAAFIFLVCGGFSHYSIPLYLLLCLLRVSYILAWVVFYHFIEQKHKLNFVVKILAAACVWVLLEYAENNLHFIISSGRGVLGYSLHAQKHILQLASIGGVGLLSFLIFVVNMLFAHLFYAVFNPKNNKLFFACWLLIAFLLAGGNITGRIIYSTVKLTESAFKIAVIQPGLPAYLKWEPAKKFENLQNQFGLINAAAKNSPSLIIWPNSSVSGFGDNDDELMLEIKKFTAQIKIPMLVGIDTYEGLQGSRKYYNSAVLVAPDGGTAVYRKNKPVPFGEYWPIQFLNPKKTNSALGNTSYSPGSDITIFEAEGVKYSAVICNEIIYPRLVKSGLARGARFVVNQSDEAWAMESNIVTQQYSMAVLRAVENRVSVVRAANSALSCVVDPRGVAHNAIKGPNGQIHFVKDYMISPVWYADKIARYSKYDAFILLCALCAVVCLIFPFRRVRSS